MTLFCLPWIHSLLTTFHPPSFSLFLTSNTWFSLYSFSFLKSKPTPFLSYINPQKQTSLLSLSVECLLYLLLRFPADNPTLGNLWRGRDPGVPGTAMREEGGNKYLQQVMEVIDCLTTANSPQTCIVPQPHTALV